MAAESRSFLRELPMLRVTLLGMGGSGKTSLINAFVNNNILEAHIPTSNPTIYYKMVPLSGSHGEQSLLEIEDTYSSYRADGKVLNENGHMVPRNVKNFLSLRRSARSPKEESSNHNLPFENVNVPRAGKYNTCADGRMGFMIVFDSSSEESYEEALNIALLMEETFKRKRARIKPVVYLVANKCDLDSESSRYQQIAHTAELFAREKGMRCWRVSARDFRQVGKLFRDMVSDIRSDPSLCSHSGLSDQIQNVDDKPERATVCSVQ